MRLYILDTHKYRSNEFSGFSDEIIENVLKSLDIAQQEIDDAPKQ